MADAEREVDDVLSGNVLSVQELNDRIASVVQDTPALNGVRCIGEVTDLHQNSTALYFTLTDGDAELPCMLWANRYQKMDADLEDGAEVILEGDIDYWTEGGKIDLKPWEVIVVGDGDQAAAVERLRSELEERGWFDDEQKQRPPAFPERVGVVTSLRGDARYDIQSAIHEQDPTVDILVKDATVQGSEAPTSIANGIHHLDRSEEVDSIIVGRGGGSDSNLQAFNTERVAEAIFTANTPTVTAIGHTDDRLIADQVADVATITPTAAGEYIVNSREEFFAGEVKPLAQQLDAAYETFQQEHEHERELAEAVDEAAVPEGLPPVYYKAAIAVLLLLLLAITGLWLGVI
ncbi:exodeoxyribonuclease VII large subunit [Haloarcula sp. S1AR25-5A]|jgi:exodeoxyribonuclease VII large subunit|uniref:Exodeoxyribonuclease VII large subunit n=2 Tax=Halobacteriales TaxID=2235 RepID=A0A8J8P7G4_9EURY|nr:MULTISPECIES: exodeoxyribonuclease VII large subunit [Halobacteria]MDS0223415.1 exodeoxyribonuclease VII large subunit [Haloarcula terrestris]TQQ78717.1 exodeoxyribonuclease VII large subunit [Halonotius terrestris]